MPHPEQQVICAKGYAFKVEQIGPFHAHVFQESPSQLPGEPQKMFTGFFLLTRVLSDQRFRCADCVDPNGCRMEYVDEVLASV